MDVIWHQTVRKNCKALRGRGDQKVIDCLARHVIVQKRRQPIPCADREEISIGPEVREVGNPARLRHRQDGFASEVPERRYEDLARPKGRAYVRTSASIAGGRGAAV